MGERLRTPASLQPGQRPLRASSNLAAARPRTDSKVADRHHLAWALRGLSLVTFRPLVRSERVSGKSKSSNRLCCACLCISTPLSYRLYVQCNSGSAYPTRGCRRVCLWRVIGQWRMCSEAAQSATLAASHVNSVLTGRSRIEEPGTQLAGQRLISEQDRGKTQSSAWW